MNSVTPLRAPPRFVASDELGRLVRYLRMLGFDSLQLEAPSPEDDRVLLTRDAGLAHSLGERAYQVRASDPREQLPELVAAKRLGPWLREKGAFLTRCLECNSLLLPAAPHQVSDRVPGHLLLEHDQFFLCPRCERVYWDGSHVERMREWVRSFSG